MLQPSSREVPVQRFFTHETVLERFVLPDGLTMAECWHEGMAWVPDDGTLGVEPGWRFVDGHFVAPPPRWLGPV